MGETTQKLTVLDQIASKDKVRRRIIDAASELYAKKGFKATAIEEIAEKAGVSFPVAHQYIKNKSEIMKMIMEDVLEAFKKNLISDITGIEKARDKLPLAIELYFRLLDQHQEKILLVYQKSNSLNRNAKSRVMKLEIELKDIFKKIIEDGIKSGDFREVDADVMSYNIIIMAHMWTLKRWYFRKRLSLDNYLQSQLTTIMYALKKV